MVCKLRNTDTQIILKAYPDKSSTETYKQHFPQELVFWVILDLITFVIRRNNGANFVFSLEDKKVGFIHMSQISKLTKFRGRIIEEKSRYITSNQ